MSKHRWADVRERLLRGGVAPRHVQRYLRELNEHLDDARRAELERGLEGAAAEQAALQRLGSEDSLVQSVLTRPELRSKGARFPALVFGAGPVLTWLALVVASALALRLGTLLLPARDEAVPPGWWPGAVQALFVVYMRALPTLLGVILLGSAARRRLLAYWPLAGLALLDVLAGTLTLQLFDTAARVVGVSSSLLPLLVPFSNALGPRDSLAFAEGLWRAAGMLGLSALAYRVAIASWPRWSAQADPAPRLRWQ